MITDENRRSPARPLVRDLRTDRVGEVMEYSQDRMYVWLRKPGGGTGWQTRTDAVEFVQSVETDRG